MTTDTAMLGQETITGVLTAILAELRRQRIADDLWNTEDVAAYLGLSTGTVRNKVLAHPTFPRAVRIPTAEAGSRRRWVAKEVRAWALKHKENL